MKSLNKSQLLKIDTLNKHLKENGIFKIESYLSLEDIDKLKKEVLDHHKTHGNLYAFGSTYTIENPRYLSNTCLQIKVFCRRANPCCLAASAAANRLAFAAA